MSTTQQGVTFTKAAAERIAKAVRQVEQMRPGQRLPTITYPTAPTFWAIILSNAGIDGRRYDFMRVAPDPANSSGADIILGGPNGISYNLLGEIGQASEANNNPDVPRFSIVRMDYIGTDADNVPLFLFQFSSAGSGSSLPIHDHRDNVTGGGFAFSVFHPGTSLPQVPWPLGR